MQQITLGQSGRQTTRLGFGCSSIMGAMGRRESLALLEAAYDAGVRHFDVAPMYGFGEAESCLGEFLVRRRDDVTVTTKYGIPPAQNRSLLSLGRRIAGPVVKRLPGVKQRLAKAANAVVSAPQKSSFTPLEAKQSLDRSLAALRTDHIDLWLLHEAEASDLSDDGLLRLLEDETQKGTIGTFGIGSGCEKIPDLTAMRPQYCRTLQYEWSVLDAPIAEGNVFRIHHRALTNNFRALHAVLVQHAETCRRWSDAVGSDLNNANNLAALMLKASLAVNPASIILFSSKSAQHIQANVATARNATIEAAARQLYQLVQSERASLLSNAGADR